MEEKEEYCAYCSVTEVNLVADDNKRKVLGVSRASLNEKFISPALKCLECVWNGDIIDKNAAVGTTVECNTQTLEPFLSSCVPDLQHLHRETTDVQINE